MCFKSKEKILQVKSNGEIYEGENISLRPKDLLTYLKEDLKSDSISTDQDGWYVFADKKISIKNVTYLGFNATKKEDRSYKKRIQFSNKLRSTYNKNPYDKVVLGHYINDVGERLYVVFDLQGVEVGKSKSSHVFVQDLANAFLNGSYSKIDKRGNRVLIVKPEFLEYTIKNIQVDSPFLAFAKFILKDKREWNAQKAISEMRDANFVNAKQTEWAGFYLEFLAEKFFQNPEFKVNAPSNKKIGAWKPDAFDLKRNVPVEIKFHGEGKKLIPGNDINGVKKAIEDYQKVFLFVANGLVEKESDKLEISIWRKKLLGENEVIGENHRKLKKQVKITEFGWCDIDADKFINLGIFKQGVQPDGSKRKTKLMYNTDMLDFKF